MIYFPLTLPDFSPTLFSIGPIQIRYYSLAYIFGIIFTFLFIKKQNKEVKLMTEKALDSWISWSVLGIIIGGRLGYVLFYNFSYYLYNPLQILAIWQGGMSFHGGFSGAIISMFIFCKKYKINFLKLCDILAISSPIGLFFGRIANFINMELYGRKTNSDYGVIFPNIDQYPRHPSQLYEAILEGLLIFIILFSLYKWTKIKEKSGFLSGLFLCFYGSARIFIEQFRQPDEHLGFIFESITMGQILSIPMILIGIFVIIISVKKGMLQRKL